MKIFLIPNLLLITDLFLFQFQLSLKTKFIFLLLRGIIKKKAYFTRLDKGKSSDIDIEVSKPMSKPSIRVHKKSVFVPTCHFCGVVGHIRPNCSLLRQNQNLRLNLLLGILMFLNLFMFVTFVVSPIIFILIVINWKLSILCLSLGYVMIFLLS